MTRTTHDLRNDMAETEMEKSGGVESALPENRLIRRRVAARTTAIHCSAIADEPWAKDVLDRRDSDGYLHKHQFPDQIAVEDPPGEPRLMSRDEAWRLADEKGEALEWALLSGMTGRIAAFFSTHGQGIYANYGRPTLDFSGFFRDRIAGVGSGGSKGAGGLQVGPLFIAFDTASAAGLTALGHFARRADLTSAPVVSDVLSTGAYEGTSSYVSAKLGVFTGVKAMGAAAILPVPIAGLGAFITGFVVGAATAIVVKRTSNRLKDNAIDAAYDAADRRAVQNQAQAAVQ
jgi:hypothetical protein